MTPRQKRFLEEFLVDLEVTAAAVRAGYSEKTAARQGRRVLEEILTRAVQGQVEAKPPENPVRTEGAATSESPATTESPAIPLAAIVAGLFKEATREGDGSSQSARVAALGHLVRVAGIADNVRHSGEIQYVPPYTPKRGR